MNLLKKIFLITILVIFNLNLFASEPHENNSEKEKTEIKKSVIEVDLSFNFDEENDDVLTRAQEIYNDNIKDYSELLQRAKIEDNTIFIQHALSSLTKATFIALRYPSIQKNDEIKHGIQCCLIPSFMQTIYIDFIENGFKIVDSDFFICRENLLKIFLDKMLITISALKFKK